MVLVLPLLLYPILGIGILQLSANLGSRSRGRSVILIGAENFPGSPPLLNAARDRFVAGLFARPRGRRGPERRGRPAGLEVDERPAWPSRGSATGSSTPWSRSRPTSGRRSRRSGRRNSRSSTTAPTSRARSPRSGSARSSSAGPTRSSRGSLARDKKPAGYTEPVKSPARTSRPRGKAGVSVWARIFPFLLVIMALTGAFYPAVDICAGEKERGTMETLLISPATRTEIVLGKFLTVMLASMDDGAPQSPEHGDHRGPDRRQVRRRPAPEPGARSASIVAPPQLSSYFWMILLLIPLAGLLQRPLRRPRRRWPGA